MPVTPWSNPLTWQLAGLYDNDSGDDKKDDDDSGDDDASDYWQVPKVEGWIVPNTPDALTPWGVNIADGIPVLSAPSKRRLL